MKIIINGEKFDVFDYDDDVTILERYSLSLGSENQSLPSFFRITDKDFVLKENLKIEIEDVRDYIGELDQYDLADENIIQDILSKYPRLKKREIGLLWLIIHPKEEINVENFKQLDRSAFLSSYKAKRSVEEFQKEVARLEKRNSIVAEEEKNIYIKLSNLDTVPVESFITEEVSIEIGLILKDKDTILDVFNAMTVSENIPFISLVYKRKRFFKVYTHLIPPDSWIVKEREYDGIYFKVLNEPPSKLSSKKILLENLYAEAFWSLDNNVYFTFKIRASTENEEDKIRNKILGVINDKLNYEIISSRQVGIKGTFTVKDFSIERYIFADLVATNELFQRFLYFDERGGSDRKIKSVLTKLRLFVHYTASKKEGTSLRSLGITITPIAQTLDKEDLSIRISGAQNFQQANAVANTFSKLLTIYKNEASEISELYKSIIPNFEAEKPKIKKKVAVDKKTKKRLMDLRNIDADMFRERYGDQCQREAQPVIISKEEADIAIRKFAALGVPNPAHKIMFFNGHYFICDPREPDDKKSKPHIWPGLKLNKPSNKLKGIALENAIEFAKKHPLLPCCYTMDQYTKKASQLRLYMAEQSKTEKEDSPKKKEVGGEHILGSNKITLPGRYGEMPFNWEKVFRHLGLKKVIKGKQKFYPILRHGVSETPDSFVHCLEKVFNPKYSSMNSKKQDARVMEVRREVADLPLNISKQETFDYTNDELVNILNDPDRYIDPDLFVSIFQKYYNCNIFLYVVNEENLNGSVVIPRHSQAYLTREIDTSKPSILIVKYEVGKDFPYQCELVSSMNISDGKIKGVTFKFEGNSPIADMAIKMFYDSNEVFIVNPEGYEPYSPISE